MPLICKSKIHPNAEWDEVDEVMRVRKLLPDIAERKTQEEYERDKIMRAKAWKKYEGKEARRVNNFSRANSPGQSP
jgi:hypothetical protein